jgi:hypothetical protein
MQVTYPVYLAGIIEIKQIAQEKSKIESELKVIIQKHENSINQNTKEIERIFSIILQKETIILQFEKDKNELNVN